MSKPNKDGWIRHRGGKCPVEKGVLVDVRYRDGGTAFGLPALMPCSLTSRWADCWGHTFDSLDIMAYRLHKPEQVEPAVVANVEAFNAMTSSKPIQMASEMPAAKYFDGPLQWRDRIREIDGERFVAELAHQGLMDRLEHERESLVQKLEAEGFMLIEPVKAEPAEDMSDWRNWKAGDLVECLTDKWASVYSIGCMYKVNSVDEDCALVFDDLGGGSSCSINDNDARYFKWHYRPSA